MFFSSIKDIATTRKFWVGLATAVINAVLIYLASLPELAPVVSALGAYGIWRIPNAK